ncbi:DUF6300 family protein [Streptomyces sp. NPDC052415]|uniref:DUF6300 family protein n=1 Tax=Streptomyces sp. NPDC052415 TaxID=3365690 RepID=UPI0037D1D807
MTNIGELHRWPTTLVQAGGAEALPDRTSGATTGNGPAMTGGWLELCPVCDADRPAATALIGWIRDSDRCPADLPQLFDDWESETMQALGWSFVPAAGASADLPSYEGHAPRGHG